jgi:predicted TIM-barrel fold metal-dependent hydrolase
VCTLAASLSIWVAATHAIVKDCSLDERTCLFRANATRIWRLAA